MNVNKMYREKNDMQQIKRVECDRSILLSYIYLVHFDKECVFYFSLVQYLGIIHMYMLQATLVRVKLQFLRRSYTGTITPSPAETTHFLGGYTTWMAVSGTCATLRAVLNQLFVFDIICLP